MRSSAIPSVVFISSLHARSGWLEFAGLENDELENDGLEQKQTYVLHTLKTFNLYDM